MKTKLFSALAVSMLLIACEPEILDDTTFDPAPVDTTYGGYNMTLKSNGVTSMYSSRGYGFIDTVPGMTVWGIATGDSLQYDPVDQSLYTTSANDTLLFLQWTTAAPVAGSYQLTSQDYGFYLDFTTMKFYDLSQIVMNVTQVTADSIYGNYQGNLIEVIEQYDSTSQSWITVPTGNIDIVSATYAIERAL